MYVNIIHAYKIVNIYYNSMKIKGKGALIDHGPHHENSRCPGGPVRSLERMNYNNNDSSNVLYACKNNRSMVCSSKQAESRIIAIYYSTYGTQRIR